jgi:uncharacterized protein
MRYQLVLLLPVLLSACNTPKEAAKPMTYAVTYFEIPVTNMDRAVRYYEAVLSVKLERQMVDGYDMALFPFEDGAAGATGALAKGDVYVPSKTGPIVYFRVNNIQATVDKAIKMGSKLLYPIKDIGDGGLVAEVEDSEGNRLALNQPKA